MIYTEIILLTYYSTNVWFTILCATSKNLLKIFCPLNYVFWPTLVIIRCLKLLVKTAVLPFFGSNILCVVPSMYSCSPWCWMVLLLCYVSRLQVFFKSLIAHIFLNPLCTTQELCCHSVINEDWRIFTKTHSDFNRISHLQTLICTDYYNI
jgi:hypothetical protein